jgi:hypothetical protein
MAEITAEEVAKRFASYLRTAVRYWVKEAHNNPHPRDIDPVLYAAEGMVHSFVVAIDGCAAHLPAFVLAPAPHADDRAYYEKRGEDWYPEAPEVKGDIGGLIREEYMRQWSAEQDQNPNVLVYKCTPVNPDTADLRTLVAIFSNEEAAIKALKDWDQPIGLPVRGEWSTYYIIEPTKAAINSVVIHRKQG